MISVQTIAKAGKDMKKLKYSHVNIECNIHFGSQFGKSQKHNKEQCKFKTCAHVNNIIKVNVKSFARRKKERAQVLERLDAALQGITRTEE